MAKTKPGVIGGRSAAPKKQRLTERTSVCLTQDDKAALTALADDWGVAYTALLRAGIRDIIASGVPPEELAPAIPGPWSMLDLMGLAREVNYVGVNLNQIARKVNEVYKTGGEADATAALLDYPDVVDILRELLDVLDDLNAKLRLD